MQIVIPSMAYVLAWQQQRPKPTEKAARLPANSHMIGLLRVSTTAGLLLPKRGPVTVSAGRVHANNKQEAADEGRGLTCSGKSLGPPKGCPAVRGGRCACIVMVWPPRWFVSSMEKLSALWLLSNLCIFFILFVLRPPRDLLIILISWLVNL